MRTAINALLCTAFVLAVSGVTLPAAELSREDQVRIIEDYLYVTGRGEHPSRQASLAVEGQGGDDMPLKCGMSAAADFAFNRNRLDRDLLASMGITTLNERPNLPFSYVSPSGRFKIHYAKSGTDAVYRANEDSDGDGVPNYVEATALIADSVWDHEITLLGYPVPPSDSFYTSESDSAAYDVFLLNLSPNFYGLAYPDSIWSVSAGHYRSTSFIKLDNDYSQLTGYENRPLDAIRVTMAHEFFHAIQFGIDPYEAENFDQNLSRRYWMEMSAVWMEEEVYDEINDYYGYLPYFFENPNLSLQQFSSISDLHPYACGIFGVFLAERYGRDAIRETWLKCGEYGVGPHMLIALNEVIDSISGGTEDFASAFAEFAQRNYFTGDRASLGPPNLVYEEAALYPMIPDGYLNRNSDFNIPANVAKTVLPRHLGAAYFRFEGGLGILDQLIARNYGPASRPVDKDTICNLVIADSLFETGVPGNQQGTTMLPLDWAYSACPDLEKRPDTCTIGTACTSYTRAVFDSTFNLSISLDSLPSPWYLSAIYQIRNLPDSHEVESFAVPAPIGLNLVTQTMNPDRFCSYTVIVTPATTDFLQYRSNEPYPVKYFVTETPDPEFRADCFGGTVTTNDIGSQLIVYPNPSDVKKMSTELVHFRFSLRTSVGILHTCTSPYMEVDLFTVSGERVATLSDHVQLEYIDEQNVRTLNEPTWQMTNDGGAQVASGVYLVVARLYCDEFRKSLIAEQKAKLALIR